MQPKKCFELKMNELHYTASLSSKCRDGNRYVTISLEGRPDASVTMTLDVFALIIDAVAIEEGMTAYGPAEDDGGEA